MFLCEIEDSFSIRYNDDDDDDDDVINVETISCWEWDWSKSTWWILFKEYKKKKKRFIIENFEKINIYLNF